jgi:hypothetical protein
LYDFETFAYLDVQKTGSSFIAKFLQAFSKEPLVASRRHGRIGQPQEGKFYFISCRDPLDQLLSLYFFGCSGSGHIHALLERAGRTEFYDGSAAGFDAFLRFVLDPANAEVLGEDYAASGIAPVAGLMSFRFVALAIPRAAKRLARCTSREDLARVYERWNMAATIIRAERLNETLRELARGPLRERLADPEAAIAWIDSAEKVNASRRRDRDDDFVISEAARRLVEEREWFMFDVIGYPRYLPQKPAGLLGRLIGR